MNSEKQYWSMTEGVFNCLIDTKRTLAFKKAIKKTVFAGDVVVDMGTGSGVLALFAADAGAKKVYAVEFDKKNVKTLKETFERNGHGDVIKIISGDVTKIALPEKVDVIIGEMIATGLIEELQIPAMNNMLKYAKKGVKVVLNKIENYVDLVQSNNKLYGHEFKVIRYEYPDGKSLQSKILSNSVNYETVDFNIKNTKVNIKKCISIKIKENGIVNGLRITSQTIFHDGTTFGGSFAYSYPIVLPIDPIEASVGDVFEVDISYKLCGGFNTLNYKIHKL